jgi:hypothetical protein
MNSKYIFRENESFEDAFARYADLHAKVTSGKLLPRFLQLQVPQCGLGALQNHSACDEHSRPHCNACTTTLLLLGIGACSFGLPGASSELHDGSIFDGCVHTSSTTAVTVSSN